MSSRKVMVMLYVAAVMAIVICIAVATPAQACACGGFSVGTDQVSEEVANQLLGAGWYAADYGGYERLYAPESLAVTIPADSWRNLHEGIDSGCLMSGYLAEDYSCIPA